MITENNHAAAYDRAMDRAVAHVDNLNGVTDGKSYIESLKRPVSNSYIVLPNGQVEFLRS
jgi:hypothetical protein